MTRFARPYRSALALTAASFATATLFFATATDARAAAPVYVAQLAQPAPDDHVIVKGTVFYCDGATCAASKSNSSLKTVCARLARKVGPLTSFTHKGEAIDAQALADCND